MSTVERDTIRTLEDGFRQEIKRVAELDADLAMRLEIAHAGLIGAKIAKASQVAERGSQQYTRMRVIDAIVAFLKKRPDARATKQEIFDELSAGGLYPPTAKQEYREFSIQACLDKWATPKADTLAISGDTVSLTRLDIETNRNGKVLPASQREAWRKKKDRGVEA